jgi:hypothetical protein
MHRHLPKLRLDLLYAPAEHDPAAVDEHEVGEDVLDFLHLVRRHDDGAAALEIVVQQRIVELPPEQEVESECGFIEHQQSRVDGHHHREV